MRHRVRNCVTPIAIIRHGWYIEYDNARNPRRPRNPVGARNFTNLAQGPTRKWSIDEPPQMVGVGRFEPYRHYEPYRP